MFSIFFVLFLLTSLKKFFVLYLKSASVFKMCH